MDSTHNGSQPSPDATSQGRLFEDVEAKTARNEVNPVVSADPNVPLTEPLNSFPAHGNGSRAQGPHLIVAPAAADPLWARRLKLVLFVLFCIELGMLLAVLPWTRVWNENSLLLAYPNLRSFLQQDFIRGVVSGLGLIDIWLGIREAVLYHEPR